MDLEQLERATRAELDRERGVAAWLRSRSRPARLALVFGLLALLLWISFALAGRPDWHVYPGARLGLLLGWFVLAAGLGGWLALRPIYQPRPSARVVLALVAFALAGPVVAALLPELPTLDAARFAGRAPQLALSCYAIGTAAGALSLLVARLVDRGGSRAGRQLVLAAAAAGLVGTAALILHCPINAPVHLLLGHATVPVGLVAGLGLARLMRRRRGGPPAR